MEKDQYSEREARHRFMAALKAAVNTPPQAAQRHTAKTSDYAAQETTQS